MPNKMATMRGCCDCGSIITPTPCSECGCFAAVETLTIETGVEYIEWVAVCSDEGETNPPAGDPGVLAGSIELTPLLPSANWCGTCLEASPCGASGSSSGSGGGSSVGGAPWTASGHCVFDGFAYDMIQQAGWFARYDLVGGTVDIWFAFWTYICGGVSNNTGVWSYIRWRYEFSTTDCDGLINPTHVETKYWSGYGSATAVEREEGDATEGPILCGEVNCRGTGAVIVPSIDACEIGGGEETAAVGQYMGTPCVFFFDDDDSELTLSRDPIPGEADHWVIKDLTPPKIEIRTCIIYPCCATEGGPPAVSFTYDQDSCRVTATSTSTAGTCGEIVRRRWLLQTWHENPAVTGQPCPDSTEPNEAEGEDLGSNETVFLSAANGCGGKYFRILLTEWDSTGCRGDAASEILTCCNCEDNGELCASHAGTLGVELLDAETCTYRLTADCETPPEEELVCGSDIFIEYILGNADCDPNLDCTCAEIDAGDCSGEGCSGGLGCGEHIDLIIDTATTLYWRVRETECGCWGPWTEELLPCAICDCCDGKYSGAILTVSVSAPNDCPDRAEFVTCDCAAVNGDYDCPATAACAGEHTKTDIQSCVQDNGVDPPTTTYNSATASWSIYCDETGYWLTLGFSTGTSNNSGSAFDDIFLGEEKPVCKNISALATIMQDSYDSGCYCNWGNTTTILADFYA